MSSILKTELEFFEKNKEDWIQQSHLDHFAVVKGNDLLGTFTTFEEAFDAGVQIHGNTTFLVKQILTEEPQAIYPALQVGLISAHS